MELTDLDLDCVPALQAYKTAEEIVEKCFLKIYEFYPERNGWYGEYLLIGSESLTVLLHGDVKATLTSKVAEVTAMKKLEFHHAEKCGSQDTFEPWLEIWTEKEK